MKVVLSYSALDSMRILRKSLKEIRVSEEYFINSMWDHILDVFIETSESKHIVVRLDNGNEIPVLVDKDISDYEIVYKQ